jgi:negative regulator of flagellin synthesis FlgM
MSVEFFGVNNLGQIASLKKSAQVEGGKKSGATQEGDQVEFSSVLQDVNKAQASAGDTNREERVEELRAQVASGSYEPDLTKVASSLLQFLMEDK